MTLPRRGTAGRGYFFICTLPLTMAVTVALPASTGSDSSAIAIEAWARIIGTGTGRDSFDDTVTSRTV